jgi:hypothetical protein
MLGYIGISIAYKELKIIISKLQVGFQSFCIQIAPWLQVLQVAVCNRGKQDGVVNASIKKELVNAKANLVIK